MSTNWRANGFLHVLMITILLITGDILFFGQTLGINLAIFAFVTLVVIAICFRGIASHLPAMILVVAILGLIVALIIKPGVIAIYLACFYLISLGMIGKEGWSNKLLVWVERWSSVCISIWFGWLSDIYSCYQNSSNAVGKNLFSKMKKLLLDWLWPIMFSFVFIVLFAVANPIIENWIQWLHSWLANISIPVPDWSRIGLLLLLGIWAWVILRHYTKVSEKTVVEQMSNDKNNDKDSSPLHNILDPGNILRCLIMFNGVFAVQTILDLVYLWGGRQLPSGVTYATYAHRGSYPLIATALLAAIFVLVTFRGQREDMRKAKILVYLWLLQNIFLVISAAQRLHLYVEMFSLSRWRIATAIWMLLVVLGLIWIIVRVVLHKGNSWLVNVNALTTMVVLYICAFINFDYIIADYNVRHCYEVTEKGSAIDLNYLEHLGIDSLPALIWLKHNTQNPHILTLIDKKIAVLRTQLRVNGKNWQGWSLQSHYLHQKFME